MVGNVKLARNDAPDNKKNMMRWFLNLNRKKGYLDTLKKLHVH